METIRVHTTVTRRGWLLRLRPFARAAVRRRVADELFLAAWSQGRQVAGDIETVSWFDGGTFIAAATAPTEVA